MLQDAQECDFLRRVCYLQNGVTGSVCQLYNHSDPALLKHSLYLSEDGIEDIQVGVQINSVGLLKNLCLVILTLLIKHIQLHTEIRF